MVGKIIPIGENISYNDIHTYKMQNPNWNPNWNVDWGWTNSLKPMCAQSWVFLVFAIILLIKLLIDRNWVPFIYFLLATIVSILLLNCLCRADCTVIAWIYTIYFVLTFIALLGFLSSDFDQRFRALTAPGTFGSPTTGAVVVTRA